MKSHAAPSFFKQALSLLLVVCLFFCVEAVSAQAYTLTGWKLCKKINFIPYSEIGSTSISHFNEALYQWNKECNVYTMTRDPKVRHSYTNFYTASTTNNRIFRVSNARDPYPASTRTTYNTTTKQVISADINLNTHFHMSNYQQDGYFDVWTLFIHEAGHVLGFDHPGTDSVMNTYPEGTIKRMLTADDKAGINYLYK